MASPVETLLRDQLTERRQKLESAASTVPGDEQVRRLLHEVDAALARMDKGTFGICDSCHETIEPDRLVADPLMEYCLDHLPRPQRQALERDLDLAAQEPVREARRAEPLRDTRPGSRRPDRGRGNLQRRARPAPGHARPGDRAGGPDRYPDRDVLRRAFLRDPNAAVARGHHPSLY